MGVGGRSGTDQSDSVPGPGLDQRVVIFPRLPPPSSHSMQSLDPKEDPPPTPAKVKIILFILQAFLTLGKAMNCLKTEILLLKNKSVESEV